MRPLRLVLITRRFWPIVGGAEKTLAHLAREWVERGCQVTILTVHWEPRWPAQILYGDVPVVRLSPVPQTPWTTVQYLRTLTRWLVDRRDEFDLVYASALRHEAYAAVRALKRRRPVVLRAEQTGPEGDCLWQLDAPCGRRIKQRCVRAEAFVAATPALERELQAAGYPRPRIHLIPDGVPLGPPPRLGPAGRRPGGTGGDASGAEAGPVDAAGPLCRPPQGVPGAGGLAGRLGNHRSALAPGTPLAGRRRA